MSKREKILSWLVGSTFFLIINVVAIKFLMGNYDTLKIARAKIEGEMSGLKQQENNRELWAQRDAWLTESLRPIGDSDVANRQLIEAIQNLAKKYTVTLESPQPGVPNRQPRYTALSIKREAKAAWTPMYDFVMELQAPGQFLSAEVDLKVDPSDKTQLRATLTVSKWFQSEAKP